MTDLFYYIYDKKLCNIRYGFILHNTSTYIEYYDDNVTQYCRLNDEKNMIIEYDSKYKTYKNGSLYLFDKNDILTYAYEHNRLLKNGILYMIVNNVDFTYLLKKTNKGKYQYVFNKSTLIQTSHSNDNLIQVNKEHLHKINKEPITTSNKYCVVYDYHKNGRLKALIKNGKIIMSWHSNGQIKSKNNKYYDAMGVPKYILTYKKDSDTLEGEQIIHIYGDRISDTYTYRYVIDIDKKSISLYRIKDGKLLKKGMYHDIIEIQNDEQYLESDNIIHNCYLIIDYINDKTQCIIKDDFLKKI